MNVKGQLKAFLKDHRGAIAMQFAIMAILLTFTAGFAVDYSLSRGADEKIQEAADSAVLAAVSNPVSFGGAGDTALQNNATAVLRKYFEAATSQYPEYNVSYTPTVTALNGHLTAKIDFSAETTTTFSNLIGVKTIQVSGTASAESARPVYVDIYALVDASGSMGIGATANDQLIMQQKLGCTLACHTDTPTQPTQFSVGNAHKVGATLRFDVVQSVLAQMITASKGKQLMTGQFRFGVAKFSNDVTVVSPITTDANAVIAAVNGMTLDGPVGIDKGMGSVFRYSLQRYADMLPAGGDGSTPDHPLTFVMIMTDGVAGNVKENIYAIGQTYGNWNGDPNFQYYSPVYNDSGAMVGPGASGELFTGFDPTNCDPFKAKNMTVMTLDLEYVIPQPIPDNRYRVIQNSLKPQILSNLSKCASQVSFAYKADSPADIQAAIKNMFETAIKSAHLST